LQWLKRAVRLARELDAVIVVEKNFGGQFLVGLLEQAMSELGVRAPVRVIDAHGGKKTRAEPIALLFEIGRAHLVGTHEVLAEQLVQFTGQGGKSPDRLDAMTHAIREFDVVSEHRYDGRRRGALPRSEHRRRARAGRLPLDGQHLARGAPG
jgi:phage terminase large subunit-like protein